jgi:hypothetical protein
VAYTAGYGTTAASVPAAIRQGIISLVIDLFEHPERSPELSLQDNPSVRRLLDAYCVVEA